MSDNLRIMLIVFSIILIIIVLRLISNRKLPIRYSLIWLIAAILILLVGAIPNFFGIFTHKIGFEATSNLVTAIILTLLLGITLILTVIVAHQKRQIKTLIQEVSILKKGK